MTELAQAKDIATQAHDYAQTLGGEDSIWFKVSPFINSENPMQILMRLNERYGGCIPLNMRSERVFFLSNVAHIRRVLVEKVDNYQKNFDGLKPIFGNAMITVDGKLWQAIRRPQQTYFHPKVYANYVPYLMTAIRARADIWSQFAKSGERVDLLEQTWTLAADMVCRALFDREIPFNPHIVFNAVKSYADVANHKSIRSKKRDDDQLEVGQDDTVAQAILGWLQLPDTVLNAPPWQGRDDTLLNLLQAAEADPDIPEFDHQQVKDELKQYLWAGTETTALTLGWMFYLLSQHPEVADKIRAECDEVLGDREPTSEDIQNLTYTRSAILETLRLYPPAWALIRTAVEDDEIAGHQVKAGDKVVLSPYIVHHDPQHWDDPETFDPDRFAPGRMAKRVKYSYLPFGGGKRFCIGGQFAQFEMVLALSQLLRRFQPEYLGTVPAPINATVTLMPLGGLPFRMHAL